MEIINLGTDIEEVARFETLENKVLERLFTKQELEYCFAAKNKAQRLAARFAAKEAAFKALPFDEIALKKIEVIKDEGGKPQIALHDKRGEGIIFKLSISHSETYATAVVITLKK